jgi:general secretion pathway protein G
MLRRWKRLRARKKSEFCRSGPVRTAPGSPQPCRGHGGRSSRENGFTLVELMVVIVIIGLLATVVVINVLPAQDTARMRKAEADIATLEQGIEMYRLNRMNYPSSGDGLQALVSEGFIKRLPDDPWGNPYRYAAPGRDGQPFDVYTYGADGREGGEGDDADIGNWKG